MPKPSRPNFLSQFLSSSTQHWEQFQRKQQHRRVGREYARRQHQVFKAADGEKAAKRRAHFFQNLRRSNAERKAAAGNALHWDTLRQAGQNFGGGPGKPKLRRFLSRAMYALAAVARS